MNGFPGKRGGSHGPLKYQGFPSQKPSTRPLYDTTPYLCHGVSRLIKGVLKKNLWQSSLYYSIR
jgi:hypothetical protein